ncbi:pseudouridine synthase, partial [uncultured Sphingomonas sp.]|uniref:pseudouridine synthase n=1 Tax=uncultured Sphingomonas sp. TaxID=158754 RepID=UPI0035CA8A42
HKPVGLLVTERDPRGRPTIYDRLPSELPRVVPVGRLDLNTEGLLLLTTDGGLKRQLELPATGVARTYRARAYGQVSQAQLEALIEGVEVEGVRYGAIDANLERRTGANVWIELTLTEGKNREVRRVLEYLGLRVGRLIRTRYGPFVLGDLPPGEVGEARAADLEEFRRTLKSGKTSGPERVVSARMPSAAVQPALPRAGGAGGGRPARHRSPEPKREPAPSPQVRANKAPHRIDAAAGRADPKSARGIASRAASPAAEARGSDRPDTPPRPPRPERKPGWARAKPKAGPRRPKPRA